MQIGQTCAPCLTGKYSACRRQQMIQVDVDANEMIM
jgi:hypothetical protein